MRTATHPSDKTQLLEHSRITYTRMDSGGPEGTTAQPLGGVTAAANLTDSSQDELAKTVAAANATDSQPNSTVAATIAQTSTPSVVTTASSDNPAVNSKIFQANQARKL